MTVYESSKSLLDGNWNNQQSERMRDVRREDDDEKECKKKDGEIIVTGRI